MARSWSGTAIGVQALSPSMKNPCRRSLRAQPCRRRAGQAASADSSQRCREGTATDRTLVRFICHGALRRRGRRGRRRSERRFHPHGPFGARPRDPRPTPEPVCSTRGPPSFGRQGSTGLRRDPRRRRCRIRCGFLVRPSLMTSYAAIYWTQVDPDAILVCCAALWFSWTCSAACTLPAALPQGLAGIRFRFAPGAPVMGEPSLSRGRATSEVLRGTSCSVSLIARLWVEQPIEVLPRRFDPREGSHTVRER